MYLSEQDYILLNVRCIHLLFITTLKDMFRCKLLEKHFIITDIIHYSTQSVVEPLRLEHNNFQGCVLEHGVWGVNIAIGIIEGYDNTLLRTTHCAHHKLELVMYYPTYIWGIYMYTAPHPHIYGEHY